MRNLFTKMYFMSGVVVEEGKVEGYFHSDITIWRWQSPHKKAFTPMKEKAEMYVDGTIVVKNFKRVK